MSKGAQNYLLAKTGLGQVKKGFHQLPPPGHIYGKAPVKDKYGAREVIGSWQSTQRSQTKQGGKDYISMNKQGLKHGYIDAKQTSQFRKGNQIKVKVKQGQKVYEVKIPSQQFTYGVPNRPSTPIKNVICNTYAAQQAKLKQQREAVLNMLQNDTNKKQYPKADLSSKQKQTEIAYPNRKKQIQNNNFKLSKFKGVQSKIKPLIENNKKNHNSDLKK